MAGQDRRIAEVTIDPSDPTAEERYGATLVELAARTYPVPWFDNSATRAELGYSPRTLREGMEQTIPWLRDNGQITDTVLSLRSGVSEPLRRPRRR